MSLTLKIVLHWISIASSYYVVWYILYAAQMYVYNSLLNEQDCPPTKVVAGLVAAMLIRAFFTFDSPY